MINKIIHAKPGRAALLVMLVIELPKLEIPLYENIHIYCIVLDFLISKYGKYVIQSTEIVSTFQRSSEIRDRQACLLQ